MGAARYNRHLRGSDGGGLHRWYERVFDTPEKKTARLQRIPAKRFASREEVAGAVVYLASTAAAMVNGDSIRVDGGWTAQ